MKLPHDILLYIAHLAHLKWVNEKFKLRLITTVYETQDLSWSMYDMAEELVDQLYDTQLIPYIY